MVFYQSQVEAIMPNASKSATTSLSSAITEQFDTYFKPILDGLVPLPIHINIALPRDKRQMHLMYEAIQAAQRVQD